MSTRTAHRMAFGAVQREPDDILAFGALRIGQEIAEEPLQAGVQNIVLAREIVVERAFRQPA